jgi:hypothetical protein
MHTKILFAAVLASAFGFAACAAPTTESDNDEEFGVSADELALGKQKTAGFEDVPDMTDEEKQAVFDRYASIDHSMVRSSLWETAILYYDHNLAKIPNKRWLSIVDFKKHSGQRRFFRFNMETFATRTHKVAHGKKSDPNDDGVATLFSNVNGSNMSSVGFYLTAETYYGAHGESLKLDGLSETNTNVRERLIVIHSAAYVEDDRTKQGMSLGCIVFSEAEKPEVVGALKEGSLIYAMN